MLLIDSNIIIYAAQPEYPELRRLIAENVCSVSVISKVEVLGYHLLSVREKLDLEDFFLGADVIDLTTDIVERAISLRQARKLSLGDAIIAATAMEFGLILVTRNQKDFAHIAGLELYKG
jgi:predicted nucleic acid-binding protein